MPLNQWENNRNFALAYYVRAIRITVTGSFTQPICQILPSIIKII